MNCSRCARVITEQPYFNDSIWVDQSGVMFCGTSDDRKSLIAHQPEACPACSHIHKFPNICNASIGIDSRYVCKAGVKPVSNIDATGDAKELLARAIERLDNVLGAMHLNLHPEMHLERLRSIIPEIAADLKKYYAEVVGENPWE